MKSFIGRSASHFSKVTVFETNLKSTILFQILFNRVVGTSKTVPDPDLETGGGAGGAVIQTLR